MSTTTPMSTSGFVPTLVLRAASTTATAASNQTSTADIVGYTFFGILTIWFWGSLLLLILAVPIIILIRVYRQTIGRLLDPIVGPPYRRWRHRRKRQRKERAEWVKLEQRRGDMRRSWAQQDLDLARKKGVRQKYVVSDLKHGDHTKKQCGLFTLPAELRMQIYAELDYGTAFRLEQVCRFFRHDKPAQGVDPEQRATYVYHAETFPKNKDRIACFSCKQILHREAFSDDQRSGEYRKFGTMELERICSECQIARGGISWSIRWQWRLRRKAWKLYQSVPNLVRRKG